jgi:hypothetical protein
MTGGALGSAGTLGTSFTTVIFANTIGGGMGASTLIISPLSDKSDK